MYNVWYWDADISLHRKLEEFQKQLSEQNESIARSEESRRQEQARAQQEMNDVTERHQKEAGSLQEKVKSLVSAQNQIQRSRL